MRLMWETGRKTLTLTTVTETGMYIIYIVGPVLWITETLGGIYIRVYNRFSSLPHTSSFSLCTSYFPDD